jgi:hypothetical protein
MLSLQFTIQWLVNYKKQKREKKSESIVKITTT